MSHVDYIYQNEDYLNNPKDQFKRILHWLEQNTESSESYSLLDLGCAQGELIHYLSHNTTGISFTGVDYSDALISAAQEKVDARFIKANIEKYVSDIKYDFVVICGVIEYLDDPSIIMDNIASYLKEGGKCLILNIFNEYDIDVRVRYRNNKYFDEFQSGWSLHSLEVFYRILQNNNFDVEKEEKFFPNCFLEPKKDPARSWMVKMPDDTLKYMNGLSQIYDSYVIEVVKGR
ncbi:MAG: hypothetical protein CMB80_30975 [Flammeovirgaceae bacterium]|jgi:trans-aconitate methyltransferase|nr:hypothetical protein [Flammeovirgaceae bacterium]